MVISIITPTFNSQNTIYQNVKSVINQSYKNFEHIIVDNISNDNTIEIVNKLYSEANLNSHLLIIREKDSGIAEAFNKGIVAAKGEVIGILNSDDYYYDESILNKVVNAFKNENHFFVHGNIFFEDPLYGSNIRKPLLCPITKAMPFNHPTMFFQKSVYEKYGLYDLDYKHAMDYEFICRLTASIDDLSAISKYIEEGPLVVMNAGGTSWKNELESIEETRKVLKKYGYWNFEARQNYILRKLRTKIKFWLSLIKMEYVVTRWRNTKWKI